MENEWNFWERRLAGETIEPTGPGHPESGFYRYAGRNADRTQTWRAVAIWYDEDGCNCLLTGDGRQPRNVEEIDAIFARCCGSPITRDLFLEIQSGSEWPDAVNPRAVSGDNLPELAPNEALAAELNDLKDQLAAWLKEIGEIKTKEQSDKAGNFADLFSNIEAKAKAAHKEEKAPFLEGGRKVDAAWKGVIEDADAYKRKAKKAAEAYLIAEQHRLDEEKRKYEAERRKAEIEARAKGETPLPEQAPSFRAGAGTRGSKVAIRTRTQYVITDLTAATTCLVAMDPPPAELLEAVQKIVNRICSAGAHVPGVEKRKIEYAA